MSGGGSSGMVSNLIAQANQQGAFGSSASQPVQQPQMNWQTGQPVQQATKPAYQPTGPNTGWNTPMFETDPTKMSPTQKWWLGNEGTAATALENQKALEKFNASQVPIDRNKFTTTKTFTDSEGNAGEQSVFDQAGYDKAVADQKAQTYTPLTNQEALNQTLRNQIQAGMGNYSNMVNQANRFGVSQADIQRAIGPNTDLYTYMNRPDYQKFGNNGQYNPTIYQSNYQNYNTGNPMAISQYGQGMNPYSMNAMYAMNTPFNPYTNSYQQQTPFSYQQAQPNYGPSQAIVSRSAGMRGTPNVVARKAEGGIASLMDSVE